MTENKTTIVLPSKGALAEPTLNFLKDCGLKVWKPNPRQYTGKIPSIANVDVMFQRVKDVVYKVADGTAQLGITGLDVVHEYSDDNIVVIHPDLRYGQCQLLVAVPESWVDVETMKDLADVAFDIRENKKRNLRVATTYTNSSRRFLHEQGIHNFTLVKADGAIEAAPTLGYADVVVDLTQTGTTLRENRLRPLYDGTILSSQACLIGNRQALITKPETLQATQILLEHIDASLNGASYYHLTGNITGKSAEDVAQQLNKNPITRGLQGPSITPMYSSVGATDGTYWYTISILVKNNELLDAVYYLRKIGGRQTSAYPAKFVFLENSPTFLNLQQQLGL